MQLESCSKQAHATLASMEKARKGIAAIFIGVLVGLLLLVLAAVFSGFDTTALALVGVGIAVVGLWIAAPPDRATRWDEIGERAPRSWWGLFIAAVSTVLALAAFFSLPFMRSFFGLA